VNATPSTVSGFVATIAAPPARGSATVTFAFRRPATLTGGSLELEAGAANAARQQMAEVNPWNNGVSVTLRTAD
jgi:hypothetical protein